MGYNKDVVSGIPCPGRQVSLGRRTGVDIFSWVPLPQGSLMAGSVVPGYIPSPFRSSENVEEENQV